MATNLLIRELVIANALAAALSIVLYMIGWSAINAVSLSLLVLCGLFLILGGALGFFLSSISFHSLLRFFRGGAKKEEESEIERRRPELKTKGEEERGQINTGKRLIIAGLVLMGELLLISLVYMAI